VALCLTPILSWAYAVETSWLLDAIKLILFIVSLAATLVIGVVPQWLLTRVVAEEKRRAFRAITGCLPRSPYIAGEISPREAYMLTWLQTLVSTKTTTVSESAIVGTLIGIATALAPWFIQVYNGSAGGP
jgi:hypothetical protein